MRFSKAALSPILIAMVLLSPVAQAAPSASAADLNIAQAKRLLADGFPEERAKISDLLTNAIRLAPRSAEAYGTLGRFIMWEIAGGFRPKSDLVLVVELAEQVKALDPDRPLGDYLKCEALYVLGRNSAAEASCKLALTAFPDHLDTHVFLARFLSDSDPKKAVEAARKALTMGANYDELSYLTSMALIRMSGEGSAGELLQNFAQAFPNRWVWQRAGVAFAAENRQAEAKAAFEKAIAMGNEIEGHLSLGILAQTKLKEFDLAEREFKSILKVLETKKEIAETVKSGVLARLSILHLMTNHNAAAAESANQAIIHDLDNRPLIQAIAEAFGEKKLMPLLEPSLAKVAKENPAFHFAHFAMGEIAMTKKQFTAAARSYTKSIALQPDDDYTYAARAHAYYEMREYSDALDDFDLAIRFRPQEASHHYNRSCMLSILGRLDESYQSLRAAILLDQSLAKLAQSDADLDNLRRNSTIGPKLADMGISPLQPNASVKESAKISE